MKRPAIVACAALLSLAGIEAGLRFGLGLGSPPLSYSDPDYGYAFRPNQDLHRFGRRVRYNEAGLRSEPLRAKSPERLRVLCVGDSVTNGGVLTSQERTFPYQLARQLEERGRPAETLNASAGSWSPENELAFLRRHGIYRADIVVIQIGTHDLWQRKSTSDGVGKDPNLPDTAPWLATGELLHRYLMPRLVGTASAATVPDGPEPGASPGRALAAVGGMVNLARGRAAWPVILATPNREELTAPGVYSVWREALVRECERLQAPLVDVLPLWAESLARGSDPLRDNVHPNETGNALLARVVADAITKAALPGRRP